MDGNECGTVIPAAKSYAGTTMPEMLAVFEAAAGEFRVVAKARLKRSGEW
jgi:4-hydroxy-4-methyl-2-oxoglutarate aldolase